MGPALRSMSVRNEIPCSGQSSPMQFGPMMRTPAPFAAATRCSRRARSATSSGETGVKGFAAAGRKKRELAKELPRRFQLPEGFSAGALHLPGILVIKGPRFSDYSQAEKEMQAFSSQIEATCDLEGLPLVVLVDDADFATESLRNFLWVTFTRSNPSHDIYGVASFIQHKHWGCHKSLIIDARLKPHHAPPLIEDPAVSKRVDALAAKGKSLHGIW